MSDDVDEIKKVLRKKNAKSLETEVRKFYLGTGSTLLNLATSGNWKGGMVTGSYYFFVGDSSSGKTFLTLTCFAEAANDKRFDSYRFIYDDVEGGALMDFEKFFGSGVANRVEPPSGTKQQAVYSQTVEEFYCYLDNALELGQPCIYVLDSMDALTSKYEQKKFEERKKAIEKGTEAKGDYGDGKAKINSSRLRACLPKLRDSGSILIIINQTRDNINASMFEPAKTRSGGHALTFYATLELWSSVGGKLKKTVRGKDRLIGITSRIRVKKNRLTGKTRTIEVPIYYEYGIDDIGSCVDYLIAEDTWKTKGGFVIVTDLGDESISLRRNQVVKYVEDNNLETDLCLLVNQTWKDVEKACSMDRKKRYK